MKFLDFYLFHKTGIKPGRGKKMSKIKLEKVQLTEERIRNIKPLNTRFHVYDKKQEGLRLMVTPAGSKTFQYYAWVKNQGATTITIGKSPKISLEDARRKVSAIAGEVSLRGKVVIQEIQAEKMEQAFENLFESWFKDQKMRGVRDLDNVRSRYTNHILPTIGKKSPSTLTEKYLTNWFLKLPKRKKAIGKGMISNTTANRCLEIVSAVFEKKYSSNPALRIKHFPEESRERYLSSDELGRFFKALEHPDTPAMLRDIVLMALTTGARKMNVFSMKWTDLNLESGLWIISAANSKNKQSMGIPLIKEAVELLEARKRKARSIFVFPSTSKTGHVTEIRKPWALLLQRAEISSFVFHDLRRTLGSWQAHIGSSDLIIGKSLGHKSPQSTRVYARIRDNNPIKESMSNGFQAMKTASEEKKVIIIKGKA